MKVFDSHCHVSDERFDGNREEMLDEVFSSGVNKIINAGYSLESSRVALELTRRYSQIYTVSGISPNDIGDNVENVDCEIDGIRKLVENDSLNKIVGIGEIGLDYYWNKENKELQKYAFIKQIELANEMNLPIVIHTREAVQDTLEILKQNDVIKKGVFHCCPLNQELIKKALKLGFYISFAGPITFKNSKNADDVINLVPLSKMLIETDSPYLSPEPFRGKTNTPKNVKYVAQKIAQVRNMSLEEVCNITYENACNIFGI